MSEADEKRYVFVDAGHLRKQGGPRLERLHGEARDVDYSLVRLHEKANRIYVFDALPSLKSKSQSEEAHAADLTNAELRLRGIESTPFVHVRLGDMRGDGGRRRQKGVDVALAVEALTHAHRGNMDHAILITADGDFYPLVRALVDAGTYVTVIGHDPAAELIAAADVYEPLDVLRLTQYAYSEDERRANPRLVGLGYVSQAEGDVEGSGTSAVGTLEIRRFYTGSYLAWIVAAVRRDEDREQWGFVSTDPAVAARAAEDALGANRIEWDEAAQLLFVAEQADE